MFTALGFAEVPQGFGASARSVTLQSDHATPDATLLLSGNGFGNFISVQSNKVTVNGVSALVQRWESDLIEVTVPVIATSGPIEVVVGKKKLPARTLAIAKPHIESITPTEGERGMLLQIMGQHFGVTASARETNTLFGVNDVVIVGGVVRPRRWKDGKIDGKIPANAASGDVVVRLAFSNPLPDGSCCAPVEHVVSNVVPISLIELLGQVHYVYI